MPAYGFHADGAGQSVRRHCCNDAAGQQGRIFYQYRGYPSWTGIARRFSRVMVRCSLHSKKPLRFKMPIRVTLPDIYLVSRTSPDVRRRSNVLKI